MQAEEHKYNTIQEYLQKFLYPTLNIAIEDLLIHIRNSEYYDMLVKEFNQNYYENKRDKLAKEKELLKLERGSDYSESDYDYFMRINAEMGNETKSSFVSHQQSRNQTEPQQKVDDDYDPDFDNSEHLSIDDNESEEEVSVATRFNAIEYLVMRLRDLNLNKNPENRELRMSQKENQEFDMEEFS
jgi:hypothetical protein